MGAFYFELVNSCDETGVSCDKVKSGIVRVNSHHFKFCV